MQSPEKEPEDVAEETSLGQSKCKKFFKKQKRKEKPNLPRAEQDRG